MGRIAKEKRLLIENLNKRLLGEQQSGNVDVPNKIFDIISKIESIFSFMYNGQVTGQSFNGSEKLDLFKNYINDTIGTDCWNKMNDLFKSQIYSFCFQSDTDSPYKMKFIAGLANAIDPTIKRGEIVNKDINNPSVQNAIKIIKNNCNNINSYYSQYLAIVDNQYKSMDYNDNYRNIWKYRPVAIERLMNGEDYTSVFNDWNNQNAVKTKVPNIKSKSPTPKTTQSTTTPTPTKSDVPTKQKSKTYTYTMRQDSSYVEMGEKVKDFVNEFVDENGKFNVSSLDLKQDPQNKDVEIKLTLVTDKDGYEGGTIYFDKFIDKNLTSEKAETVKLKEGTFLNKKYAFLGFKNKIAYRYDPQGNVLNRRDSSDFRNYLRTLQIQ